MLICSFLPTYLVVFILLLHVVSRYIRYSLTDDGKGALKVHVNISVAGLGKCLILGTC